MTQSLKSISCALSLALCATMLTFTACSDDGDDADSPVIPDVEKSWHLEWQDDFNGPELDIRVWSRIPEGTPDWAKYQSLDDRCYEFRDGALVLKGIVNDDSSADPRPYLCGGIWTRGKKSFEPGRIAIRAKFDKGAQGAWPAIWMMPFSPEEDWPYCGEIDIMERLNHDRFVYQTLHSGYTDVLGHKSDPVCGVTPAVSADEYHIYEPSQRHAARRQLGRTCKYCGTPHRDVGGLGSLLSLLLIFHRIKSGKESASYPSAHSLFQMNI